MKINGEIRNIVQDDNGMLRITIDGASRAFFNGTDRTFAATLIVVVHRSVVKDYKVGDVFEISWDVKPLDK